MTKSFYNTKKKSYEKLEEDNIKEISQLDVQSSITHKNNGDTIIQNFNSRKQKTAENAQRGK